MRLLNLIIYLLIAWCLLLFQDVINNQEREIGNLREKIGSLREEVKFHNQNAQLVIDEVKEIMEPFTHVIPISEGYLLMRGDEKDEKSSDIQK